MLSQMEIDLKSFGGNFGAGSMFGRATLVDKEGKQVLELMDGEFLACRERFADRWKSDGDQSHLLFTVPFGFSGEKVIECMMIAEDKLKLENKSIYGITQLANLIWVSVSDFWKAQLMRKSFFTALLRASLYYKDNFEEAIFKYDYFKHTKIAVDRFLSGYTSYKGTCCGWLNAFRERQAMDVEQLLGPS